MSRESYLLVSEITAEAASGTYLYSDKKQGAGYHRQSNGLHTAVYEVDSFIGVIKLQGTLELYPGENDWVDIADSIVGLNDDSTAWTTTQSVNFTGNYVWIRAAYNLQNGRIIQIRFNY